MGRRCARSTFAQKSEKSARHLSVCKDPFFYRGNGRNALDINLNVMHP